MMPLFGPASAYSAHQLGDGWDETDTCDAEMLASFLLDDESDAAGMTFDFNVYNPKSDTAMISSESSDDEGLSEAGSMHMDLFLAASKRVETQVLLAPAPSHTMPLQMPSFTVSKAYSRTLPSSHRRQATTDENEAKRRRYDAPGSLSVVAPVTEVSASVKVAKRVGPTGRKKNQVQVERRRERNRIIARRARLAKKSFFEALKQEVLDLHRENQMLKDLVKLNMGGDESTKIFMEGCDATSMLPEGVLEACNESDDIECQDFSLIQSTFSTTNLSVQNKARPFVVASDDIAKPSLGPFCKNQLLL